ncbi:hypothetical protein [Luteimonas terrae]|uniref:Uncharacterized protein n=1 Tax=Luteimonas terrae TaxID=1530191 RepID=A0A4R5UC45_9GAMM|nr:hypothetical protein [Luteimonas terrae]TDK32824.1 hypothetical protein E2F49_01795 [Luteimonas terrae]
MHQSPRSKTSLFAACIASVGVADAHAGPVEAWGLMRETAIEVCKPQGQHHYLARLVCPDRSHPAFERSGNVGPCHDLSADTQPGEITRLTIAAMEYRPLEAGEVDHHMVDRYELTCGPQTSELYLDMYHCDAPVPQAAPAGFSIAN